MFPQAQAIPLPYHQVSFQASGQEILRYHFGPELPRPFCFPLIGPSGFPVIRMGHPHDPVGHGHHLGIWIAHASVDGVNFWSAKDGPGTIRHDRVLEFEDGAWASMTSRLSWIDPRGTAHCCETRKLFVTPLPNGESFVDFEITFEPARKSVSFDKTSFGFLAVRVAKTMGVADGDGRILSSEGGVNEEGVFHKPARWMDYSGPIAEMAWNGITFMDHPANPRHPTPWHVRDDGWMGAAFSEEDDFVLKQGEELRLRYRLWSHDIPPAPEKINEMWEAWART